MSRAADSFNGDMASAVNHLFNFPETIEKLMFPLRAHDTQYTRGVSSIPVDILDTPEEYIFYMDVPGLSKSEIQKGRVSFCASVLEGIMAREVKTSFGNHLLHLYERYLSSSFPHMITPKLLEPLKR